MSKVFAHETVGDFVVCRYCDQLTLYPVGSCYCSSVCRDLDQSQLRLWWRWFFEWWRP